jgi:hypothetical protein
MYPHTPHVTEHDEPTMADLRGVLPGQRPPVDATVLDEPTSEVPMIRPPGARGGTDAGPDLEMERTIKARPAAPAPEPEPEPDPEPEIEPEPAPPAEAEVAEEVADEPAEATAEAELAEAEPEALTTETETTDDDESTENETEPMEAETAVETPNFPEPPAPAAEPGLAPTPAITPPVVAAFAASPAAEVVEAVMPSPADGNSEMAKMSWNAPPPPPGLTSSATDFFEPEPAAEPEFAPERAVAEATEVVAEPVAETEPEVTEEPEAPEAPAVAPAPPAARGPGDVAENAIALWTDEAADRLRGQWRDLQVEFIDDPNAAVTGAKDLVTEAVQELADTLLTAQDELDPFHGTDQVDTESMRVAMRRYREFLDRVLAL